MTKLLVLSSCILAENIVPTFELVGGIKTFILRAIARKKSRARRIWKVIRAVRTTYCDARVGASITRAAMTNKKFVAKKKLSVMFGARLLQLSFADR